MCNTNTREYIRRIGSNRLGRVKKLGAGRLADRGTSCPRSFQPSSAALETAQACGDIARNEAL
jgi:hypothetical protein